MVMTTGDLLCSDDDEEQIPDMGPISGEVAGGGGGGGGGQLPPQLAL